MTILSNKQLKSFTESTCFKVFDKMNNKLDPLIVRMYNTKKESITELQI